MCICALENKVVINHSKMPKPNENFTGGLVANSFKFRFHVRIVLTLFYSHPKG